MSDRPAPANGKRNVFWGTRQSCAHCGRCLCYACHPRGPCVDERTAAAPPHEPGAQAVGHALLLHT